MSCHFCSLLHSSSQCLRRNICSLFQVASCGHVFCKNCLQPLALAPGLALCSFCSTPFTVESAAMEENYFNMKNYTCSGTTFKEFRSSIILNRIPPDEFQTSTKIEALVCLIYNNLFPVLDLQLKRILIVHRRSQCLSVNLVHSCEI